MPNRLVHSIAIALTLSGGCTIIYGDDLDRKQCETSADCVASSDQLGSPLVCRANACQRPLCVTNDNCPSDATCIDNQCVGGSSDAGVKSRACTQDSMCGAGERCGFDGFCYSQWGCLDDARDWPTAPPTIKFSIPVRNIGMLEDPTAVPDLAISACSGVNPACPTPNIEAKDYTISSDKLIQASIQRVVPAGFTGYMSLKPTAAPGILPTYVFFTSDSPLVSDFYGQTRLLMIESALFQVIASAAMVPLNANAATIAVRVHDCGGRTASGVSMSAPAGTYDPGAPPRFVPIQSETSPLSDRNTTTEDGAGILVNVLGERLVTYRLRDEASGRVLTDAMSFIPKNNAVNFTFWYPRYRAQQAWMAEAKRKGLVQ